MSRDPRPENREPAGRRKRTPLGVPQNRLAVDTPNGYVGRWVNDEENRIQSALKGDYQFVKDGAPVGTGAVDLNTDLGSYTSQIVGTKEDHSPLTAYWMVIKKEYYEEDQREKLKPVDEIEKAIKGGKYQPAGQSSEGQYVPKSGIKIQ